MLVSNSPTNSKLCSQWLTFKKTAKSRLSSRLVLATLKSLDATQQISRTTCLATLSSARNRIHISVFGPSFHQLFRTLNLAALLLRHTLCYHGHFVISAHRGRHDIVTEAHLYDRDICLGYTQAFANTISGISPLWRCNPSSILKP